MKVVSITIPAELDARAAAEAARRGMSKSELFREGLRAVIPAEGPPNDDDPWVRLAGFGSADVIVEPGTIDDIVYGS